MGYLLKITKAMHKSCFILSLFFDTGYTKNFGSKEHFSKQCIISNSPCPSSSFQQNISVSGPAKSEEKKEQLEGTTSAFLHKKSVAEGCARASAVQSSSVIWRKVNSDLSESGSQSLLNA